jgi:RNA recognition motif-containing protein
LFRTAGNIVRADINIGADGRAKGSGTVIFETAKDAQQAISASNLVLLTFRCKLALAAMYNGYDWYGRTLEVREVSWLVFFLSLPIRRNGTNLCD